MLDRLILAKAPDGSRITLIPPVPVEVLNFFTAHYIIEIIPWECKLIIQAWRENKLYCEKCVKEENSSQASMCFTALNECPRCGAKYVFAATL